MTCEFDIAAADVTGEFIEFAFINSVDKSLTPPIECAVACYNNKHAFK
jgi:hypothetical protein